MSGNFWKFCLENLEKLGNFTEIENNALSDYPLGTSEF